MALSSHSYPTTIDEAAAAIPGATFTAGWLCDEVSGDMAPVFGAVSLVASGAITYGQPGPRGGADRCIEFPSVAGLGRFDGGNSFDVAATDDLVVAWVGKWSSLPSSFGGMFGKAAATFTNGWFVTGTDGSSLALACGPGTNNGAGINGSSAFHLGLWHVGIAVVDRSTGRSRIGTRSLAGVTVVSSEGTAGATSFLNASHFCFGTSDWIGLNDHFQLSALYVGTGAGAAAGLSAGLSSGLTRFADTVSQASVTRDYAQMLFSLLPPGKLWRVVGSQLYNLLLGCADEIVRLHDRGYDLVDESDPTTATEMLTEYEDELGIDQSSTLDERRANIVARTVSPQGFRPDDFRIALAPLLVQDPEDVTVIERSLSDIAAMADQREVFRFFVYRNPIIPGKYFPAGAQALIDDMQPAHVKGQFIESVSLICDDPHSLSDRDLLVA